MSMSLHVRGGLELRSRFARAAALLVSLALVACQARTLEEGQAELARAQVSAQARWQVISRIRLDAPVTADNSVPFTFEDGPTLRVPKILFDPNSLSQVGSQTVQARALALKFWYPDMTLADFDAIAHDANHGHPPEHLEQRFWVTVLYMYYVPPDSDSFVPGSQQPPFKFDPRPPRIELNNWCFKLVNGHCYFEMVRIPSGLVGIDAVIAKEWLKNHPDSAINHPQNGGVYLAKAESPYELFMRCGSSCDGFVYSKTHSFQYRIKFPNEAVAQTDALIKKIDQMIDTWSRAFKAKK